MNALEKAIKRAGSQGKLGRALGLKQQHVFKWKMTGRVPAHRVLAVESVTGVPRWQLRPDLYPPAEYRKPKVAKGGG